MKYVYPSSHLASDLSTAQLVVKIARHSACSACSSCAGLHPELDDEVVLDDKVSGSASLGDLGQYGSDDEDNSPLYLDSCACGHGSKDHGATEAILGKEEFARRSRVAIRLDELLQEYGKLLDFDYSDDDIVSLRKQMKLPMSSIGPSTSNPIEDLLDNDMDEMPKVKKRRKISYSSASDDSGAAEDEPLASRVAVKSGKTPRKSGQRGGKTGKSSKSSQAKTTQRINAMNMDKGVNGKNGHDSRVKVEEKMDDVQLTRLAVGVPVDAASPANGPPVKIEKMATVELRKGVIRTTAVENDGQPRSCVILTGLKTLFQKQLPKMPREYIARLVYDSNSKALAIIKRGYKVVGGICYRPFPQREFAEIVFFATASVDQVKGYGGMLMDHFKAHIRKSYPTMMHFLTYADNYAVGYFEKQGFSKDITLDRAVWAGYIKDYEGGTIMQCTMLDKVDYLDKAPILAAQQEAVVMKIRQLSKSHIVHPGLPQFLRMEEGVSVDYREIPGLRESGWSPEMDTQMTRPTPKNAEYAFMEQVLHELRSDGMAWPFLEPVKSEDVADYYDVVKNPMDFKTMEQKLENRHYASVDDFSTDMQLIFDNCRLYNPPESTYVKGATKLEKMYKKRLAEHR